MLLPKDFNPTTFCQRRWKIFIFRKRSGTEPSAVNCGKFCRPKASYKQETEIKLAEESFGVSFYNDRFPSLLEVTKSDKE